MIKHGSPLTRCNGSNRTKQPAFIQAQSVDGAFLASATRCPTSRVAERLAEKRKAAMTANKYSHALCTQLK